MTMGRYHLCEKCDVLIQNVHTNVLFQKSSNLEQMMQQITNDVFIYRIHVCFGNKALSLVKFLVCNYTDPFEIM